MQHVPGAGAAPRDQADAEDEEAEVGGLIYATEDYGYIDFSVPRFAEFMRRHMPYQVPRRRPGRSGSGG